MYRNFGNQGRGNSSYNSESGSPHTGSSSVCLGSTSTSTTQQEQKFTMAGSGQFVPSLNAITTSQDLQWLVQPSLMAPPGPSQSPRPPYPGLPVIRHMSHAPSQPHLRPGVIRTAAHSVGSTRRRNDEHVRKKNLHQGRYLREIWFDGDIDVCGNPPLTPEELERRRVRRERNKLAAAKCRNRRRELTDTLQNETDQLEDEKSRLQKEIAELQKERDKLELVLEAHRPICKIEDSDSDSDTKPAPSSSTGVKLERRASNLPGPSKFSKKLEKPKPKITIPTRPTTLFGSVLASESESLHTPVLTSTPSLTPFAASLVFTYPTSGLDTGVPAQSQAASTSSSPLARKSQPCGVAHRRSSSSGDQSDHSLHSPPILTL